MSTFIAKIPSSSFPLFSSKSFFKKRKKTSKKKNQFDLGPSIRKKRFIQTWIRDLGGQVWIHSHWNLSLTSQKEWTEGGEAEHWVQDTRVECLRQVITGWASLPHLRLPPRITEDSFFLHINSLTVGRQEEERAWVNVWTATWAWPIGRGICFLLPCNKLSQIYWVKTATCIISHFPWVRNLGTT